MFTYLIFPPTAKPHFVIAITINDNKITFYVQNESFDAMKRLITEFPVISEYLNKVLFSAKRGIISAWQSDATIKQDLLWQISGEKFLSFLEQYEEIVNKKHPNKINVANVHPLWFDIFELESSIPFTSVHAEPRENQLRHVHLVYDRPVTRDDLIYLFTKLNNYQLTIKKAIKQKSLPFIAPYMSPRVMNDIIEAYENHQKKSPDLKSATGNSPYAKIVKKLKVSTQPISPSVWEHTQCLPMLNNKNVDNYVSCVRQPPYDLASKFFASDALLIIPMMITFFFLYLGNHLLKRLEARPEAKPAAPRHV